MKLSILFTLSVLVISIGSAPAAYPQILSPRQQLARDIFKELIEINTTDSAGNTTIAAEAMAKRLKDGGFSAADVHVLADC